MTRETAKEVVLLMGLSCAVSYPVYSGITGTGLFLWFADLELTLQGKGPYEIDNGLISIPVFAISVGILFAVSLAAGWVIDRLPFAPAAARESSAAAPEAGNRSDAADVLRVQQRLVVFFWSSAWC